MTSPLKKQRDGLLKIHTTPAHLTKAMEPVVAELRKREAVTLPVSLPITLLTTQPGLSFYRATYSMEVVASFDLLITSPSQMST